MKKALSLILTLCLALASFCAVAESDVTGIWYLISMGMTAGTIELNADDACVFSISSDGEKQEVAGTWSMEGDVVTLAVNGEELPLTYDGTNLMLGGEALAAFGMDETFSAFISLSREPGAITTDEFSAYQADGTIPEGKTAEDMEAIQNEMMTLTASLFGMTGLDVDMTATNDTPAELTILDENFYVRESYGTFEGYYLAKIQNNNEAPVYMDNGLLVLKDAEGAEVGRVEYISDAGSRYLEPGEISFVSMYADVNEGSDVASWEASVTASNYCWSTDIAVPVSGSELVLKDEYNNYVTSTITNTADEPLSGLCVASVVLDENGKMVALASTSLGQHLLASGSTIVLVQNLDSRTVEYCQKNQIQLSGIESYGWTEPQQ